MAENDPKNWTKAPGFNTWGHAGIPKDNKFYRLLDETKEKTDAVFEVVNLTFDLVNSALDFIASLLIDFTNPLKPIIEEIIALLESFISDLRNFGWYLTYDKREFEKNPAESLLGGYPAFENRMVQKLLDQSDLSRPNFSPQSKVFAITLFAGADLASIGRIISLIKATIKMFTPGKGTPLLEAGPINVQVGYYNSIVGDIELPNQYKPDGIRVKWNLPPPKSTNKNLPKTFVLPDYFLFSVATRNANDRIAYINCLARESTDKQGIDTKGRTKSNVVELKNKEDRDKDARLWPLLDVKTVKKLDESGTIEPLDKTPDGLTEGNHAFILVGQDNTPYLNNINGEKITDIYKCFVYGGGVGGIVGDNDFAFDIPLENLKVNNELKPEYFITMYGIFHNGPSVDENIFTGTNLGGFRLGKQIEIDQIPYFTPKAMGDGLVLVPNSLITKPSQTVTVKSPSELREKYLKAVKFYYLSLLLAQPLQSPQKEILGFEATPQEHDLIKLFLNEDLFNSNQSKQKFAQATQKWLKKIMLKFKSEMPSDAVLKSFKDSLDKIEQFPFKLEKMIENAGKGSDTQLGIFPSVSEDLSTKISSVSITGNELLTGYESGITDTLRLTPGAPSYSGSVFIHDKWTTAKSPVIYLVNSGDFGPKFVGHLFYTKGFKETFNLSRRIVLTRPPSVSESGQWLNQRPFRDSDLSSLTEFIDKVKKYMEGFLKGLEGIVAQILKYIHMLKTRIAQVQAIIMKIKALIDAILSFRFPAGLYATFHLADGTAGLISALQQSEDKPDIGTSGYGSGLMMVAGGVPSILIDLFIAICGGEGNDQ